MEKNSKEFNKEKFVDDLISKIGIPDQNNILKEEIETKKNQITILQNEIQNLNNFFGYEIDKEKFFNKMKRDNVINERIGGIRRQFEINHHQEILGMDIKDAEISYNKNDLEKEIKLKNNQISMLKSEILNLESRIRKTDKME